MVLVKNGTASYEMNWRDCNPVILGEHKTKGTSVRDQSIANQDKGEERPCT